MSKPLHIAIVARAMSHPVGGVREFVRDVCDALMALGSEHRFTFYYADPELLGRYPDANEKLLSASHKLLWDHWVVPRELKKDDPDVVWFPHNVMALNCSFPAALTIYDMLYFDVPDFATREYAKLDCLYMRKFIPRSINRARKVMTISDWTARDAHNILGTPMEKMRTVYLAAGPEFRVLDPKPVADTPFFFYAGTLSPRKNTRRLFEAFGKIAQDVPHDLVLTGGGQMLEVDHSDIVAEYGLESRIKRRGLVSKQELVELYNSATAFVFPSLYEGFGIPPLEAFACDCPVISSDATSLSEVVSDAGLIVDPLDVDALAAAMKRVVTEEGLRESLICAGRERAKQFSYAKSAREILEVLEDVV
jgi:glycosyltransferase involved in cell wall biosynthesis